MSETETATRFEELVDTAEGIVDRLDEDSDEGELDDLEELYEVAVEAADLLEDIDLSELPSAVDASKLADAIDASEIPEALGDGDADGVVDLRALLAAIDLRELFDATDVRALWSDKRKLEDAVDDVTDEEAGEEEGLLDGDGIIDGDDDGGLTDGSMTDVDAELPSVGDDDGGVGDVPDEAYQVMIQKKAMEGVDTFREGVLEAHEKLAAMYEENRERMRRQQEDRGVSSRNPTAHSTVPTDRLDTGGTATQHSTVPSRTRYSTAPSRERIYGNRFRNQGDST